MTAPTPNNMPGAAPAAPPAEGTPPAPAQQPVEQAAPTPPQDPPAQQPPAAEQQSDNRPPWERSGEPFDPERAWNLIQNKDKDLAELRAKTDPIVNEWEQLRRASQSDLERANEDIGNLTAERDTWRNQAVRARAETLAAGRFVDAETALALIGDLTDYTGPNGIDTPKLMAAFDQLAATKPFLVTPQQPPGFTPNRGQGQSGTGSVTPAQIAAHAESQQDWNTSFAAKTQQLMDMRNNA